MPRDDEPTSIAPPNVVPFAKPATKAISKSSSVSACKDKLKPAGAKIAAAQLQRLASVYALKSNLWREISADWIEAVKHVPPDLLCEAVSSLIRQATSGDYFPRPGDILALCEDSIATRQTLLEHATAKADPWPKWLEELWGPPPDGPRKRAEAMRQ